MNTTHLKPVTPAKRARNERMWAMQADIADRANDHKGAAHYRALIQASQDFVTRNSNA
jgi:hypothetical protein